MTTPEELRAIVEKKATCPFIVTAVAMGLLPVRKEANNPLPSIEDVRSLGNSGVRRPPRDSGILRDRS
jgi:hypothetical protein